MPRKFPQPSKEHIVTMKGSKWQLQLLLAANVLGIAGCSGIAENPSHAPSPETKISGDAPQTNFVQEPAPIIALTTAPKAYANLRFLSSSGAQFSLSRPLGKDSTAGTASDPAASGLVDHDRANNIAGRCAAQPNQTHKKDRGAQAILPSSKMDEVEAKALKVGLIPNAISPTMANQLTDKTRVWKIETSGFDFYRILSDAHPDGLRPDTPFVGCIRYSMFTEKSELYSDMIFSVTYDPKIPEVIKLAPVRLYYRDFGTLSAGSGTTEAALKVELSLRGFSIERTYGRQATTFQNEEMATEIIRNKGDGRSVYQIYDPVSGPSATLPLPPWDYSSTSVNPRHNLSILGITVTEIADFDWLQARWQTLWPSWEYEATDVSKIKIASQFYAQSHMNDAAEFP